ncbi:MAG: hypothetical protein PHH30_02965 [Bacteroidales bacterium]|nr:hypothetical protein [Bacteroidales bacterium]MDD3860315.1 hypothetical protein [Bacteroidales bacterium]
MHKSTSLFYWIRNHILILIMFITISGYLMGQDTISNSSIIDDSTQYSYLMINSGFSYNKLEHSVNITEKIPSIFNKIDYYHKSGIYLGGSFSNYFSDSLQSFEYEILAGFQKYYDNGFDFDISYAWHDFNGNTKLEGINYTHSFDIYSGYEFKNNYLSSDFNLLIGENNVNYFLDIDISRFISFDDVLLKNSVLMINPTLSFAFGTDYWVYSDLTIENKTQLQNFLSNRGYSYNNFCFQGINIMLPISYGINNLFFTFSGIYRIPSRKFKFIGMESGFGTMISLTYFYNFKGTNK